MAKRFTDSDKWKDEWFCDLFIEDKLTYLYILDNCDQVGVWKPNLKLAEFQLGFKVDWARFKESLGEKRLFEFNGNWWLVKFCDFQYGKLTPDSKSPTTHYYIKQLKKHSLWIAYTKGMYTFKDKEKDKDKEYLTPKDFLKKHSESDLQELNMKSGLSVEAFEICITQWSLKVIEKGWEYSEDEAKDLKRLMAGFEKWLNTWVANAKKEVIKTKPTITTGHKNERKIADLNNEK